MCSASGTHTSGVIAPDAILLTASSMDAKVVSWALTLYFSSKLLITAGLR